MKVIQCLYCGSKDLTKVTYRLDANGILRCGHCGIMMVENLSDDTEQLYTADYFEKDEGTKNGYSDYLSSPVANLIGKYAFSRLFARKPGSHLDLGCADGSLMEIFSSEGFESHGLEISKAAVAIANAKGLDVEFSMLDPFPKDTPKADVITAFDILEHAFAPRVVLTEAFDHLNDNGYFVFSTLSVKHDDPSDYWYNNSLEHYIYYNKANLTYALTDVFGEGNFLFADIEINGVFEFWGFAKKGKIESEGQIIEQIKAGGYDQNNPETAFLVSLYYNQLSKFKASERIIKHFEGIWSPAKTAEAKFYLHFFQGQFEVAIEGSKSVKHLLSAQNSVFWQALRHAEEELFKLKLGDTVKQSNEEIMGLREQLFQAKGEIHRLRNYRVIRELIRGREALGPIKRKAINGRIRLAHKAKDGIRTVVPLRLRRRIKSTINREYQARFVTTKVVASKPLVAGQPLVTVVIPFYNLHETIDDTIKSLAGQTYTAFETIIVDDGSTDPLAQQKLAELEKNSLKVRIVHQKNQGTAAARNKGVSEAKGRYVICLDADDMIGPTFIEKTATVMEAAPDIALVTTDREDFGVLTGVTKHAQYDPLELISNNMVVTAAAFRKEAWKATGGYKSGLGYEDWEFWLNLSEHGFWGKLIPEPLFFYRTSMKSRFIGDKDAHWNNMNKIRGLHPKYKSIVGKLFAKRQLTKLVVDPSTALANLGQTADFAGGSVGKPNILITVPWMTFGGAETLIYNYCREIKDHYNMTFVTGLKSDHEWEYKFKEITPLVYHLANLFDQEDLYLEFISNYIATRQIDILHIIHNGFTFGMLQELKRRHPKLKVALTVFNDRAEYFEQSLGVQEYIDEFSTDNKAVSDHYAQKLDDGRKAIVIPNGINCFDEFSPHIFNREQERAAIGLAKDDLAVIFVGRMSEEKNPDVFLNAANTILNTQKTKHVKFLLIGDGPMMGKVKQQMKDINNPSVIYLGYQAKPARYFYAADIFVLPSSIEGFPLSILEAMAMEAAVIASRVGAVSDIINSGVEGLIVTPGSDKEIVDAINKLREDPALLHSFQSAARQKVEKKYSNKALGENYRKLYDELAK